MGDVAAEFVSYFNALPKQRSLCRYYERNDVYCVYGEDIQCISKILSTVRIQKIQSPQGSLSYVNLTRPHFLRSLNYVLFVLQYKIEILKNEGTVKRPEWNVIGKASPGNLTAVEDLLFSEDNSYVMTKRGLIAIKTIVQGTELVLGLAYCDVVLREIQICEFRDNLQLTTLESILAQLSPQECLLPLVPGQKQNDASPTVSVMSTVKTHNIAVTECKPGDFDGEFIEQDLKRLINIEEGAEFKTFELGMKHSFGCVAAVIKYLELLSDESNFGQFTITPFKSELFAKVDMSCEKGLTLFPESKSDFHEKSYLFGFLNSCFTSSGERLLIQWIKQPLMDVRKLEDRLDIVEAFVNDIVLHNEASKVINKFVDIEMIARKIQRRKAGLQDLYKVYQMILKLPQLKVVLAKYEGQHMEILRETFINELQERIDDFENYKSMVSSTIDFEAIQNKEFIVKADFDEDLKELKEKMDELKSNMEEELEEVKRDLGLPTVKLESYDKMGYVFRITLKEETNLRNKKGYKIIDTRNAGVRFQNADLKQCDEEYQSYKKKYDEKQKSIVSEIVEVSGTYVQPLKLLNGLIAWLDVSLVLAKVARNATKPYVRPRLREKGSGHIVLKQVRHPVIEDQVQNYIPNDVEITSEKHLFYFVTGPNMGGKSTYIRSIALNVLLAQIGSFVPCDEAEISVVDGFFTRIGACDKPSKAMSTFMYEMLEMKNMISGATSASLLIIDEMGRGTSTYDGLGLSWSLSKHIAESIKAPCLFATHFHQLTTLSHSVTTIGNLHVDAICSDGDVTFLYHVKPGVCSESFGIHVAKMAGFPEEVIEKAEKKLMELEDSHMSINEICDKFSSAPNGKIVIDTFRELFPMEIPSQIQDEAMDVDGSNTNLSSTFNVEKAEHLVKFLESMLESQ